MSTRMYLASSVAVMLTSAAQTLFMISVIF